MFALLILRLAEVPRARGQEAPALKGRAAAAEALKRIQELEKSVSQRVVAGELAKAIPLAKERVEVLERILGKHHSEAKHARQELSNYQRVALMPPKEQTDFARSEEAALNASAARRQGRYSEAEKWYRQARSITIKIFGENHPRTLSISNDLAETLRVEAKFPEAEAILRKLIASEREPRGDEVRDPGMLRYSLGVTLASQGKFAEAELMLRSALAEVSKPEGEVSGHTAVIQNSLALTFFLQARYGEAEELHRKALRTCLKLLGENHAETAGTTMNLASALRAQGRLMEAEELLRKALATWIRIRDENHPETARAYHNLANGLLDQGKYPEAEVNLRHALAIKLMTLRDGHPDIAKSLSDLAVVLRVQGKYAEAEAMLRRALAIYLKELGEGDLYVARSYTNLANVLGDQARLSEAEPLYRKALEITRSAVGENNAETAQMHMNLATALGQYRGQYAEAERLHRKALAIQLKVLGDAHPDTALNYTNLGDDLQSQGKVAEAEAMHRTALAIRVKTLGSDHPATAKSYNNLAWTLDSVGKTNEALGSWIAAAETDEKARLLGAHGLESSLGTQDSPLPPLALALAGAGLPREAWSRCEHGLARGVLDETVGRASRPLSAADRRTEADLLARDHAVDEQIGRIASKKIMTQEDERKLADLKEQAGELRRRLLELSQQFDARYGILAGKPCTLEEAQKAIPKGTVLVEWVDTTSRYGACVLKEKGDPVWVLNLGNREKRTWARDEQRLAGQLRRAISPETKESDWRSRAEALARQRIEPIKEHIKGVRRIIVINSPGMAGVPVEVLLAAQGVENVAVSYCPSASMFAYLQSRRPSVERPATLLALGDPSYPEQEPERAAPEPPAQGLYISRVVPHGNADLNGLRAGDVLTEYDGRPVKTIQDLPVDSTDRGPKKIPVCYWREGESRSVEVAGSPLGVELDRRPPSQVVLSRRVAEHVLEGDRGGTWQRLPGTRREIEAIARLFPAKSVRQILGGEACESTLQALASAGSLSSYRFFHLATHGRSDPHNAYRSTLILAPDPDRSPKRLDQDTDGTITAQQIVETWALDADLVVLSACESGLGRYAHGEGYLGFSQALFSKGARSLVLSLWKVDDRATALLMTRFYENLLGKRDGLPQPMPKAEALHEAKRWLRELRADHVEGELAALERGTKRRKGLAPPPKPDSPRPFEHPYYWAAFMLVGNPN
jgi:CHAT domain-containing protein